MTRTQFDWQGQLRIYLSVAPGAGAARRMLADAHIIASQGFSVGIGFGELGRLEPLTVGLKLLPMRQEEIDGEIVETLDLEAVRADPPALVLMGNMAHTYGPRARHAHRDSEIRELLSLGCAVSLNLYAYELEPLVPIYKRLTRLEPPNVVPSSVLDKAEVIFVDADPDEMIRRVELGEVLSEERVPLALRTLYRREVLTALRRATLTLLEFRGPEYHERGIDRTNERVMVCVGYNPNSSYLIKRARQIADGLGADMLAVHVRPPSGGSSGYEVTLQQNLALAEDLGAQTMVPKGRDVGATLLHIARTYGVTAIIIGRPARNRWEEFLRGSLLTQLLNADRSIDVYVIAEAPSEGL